jgi:hypothetical protein
VTTGISAQPACGTFGIFHEKIWAAYFLKVIGPLSSGFGTLRKTRQTFQRLLQSSRHNKFGRSTSDMGHKETSFDSEATSAKWLLEADMLPND